MDIIGLGILLAFAVFAVTFSWEIWVNPDSFLRKRRELRQRAYNSRIGFLYRSPFSKGFDKSPEMELWLGRIGFAAIYLLTLYLIGMTVLR